MSGNTDISTATTGMDKTAITCVRCGERPRFGSLTRCKVCLRADADQDRQQREARAQKLPRKLRRCP